MNKICYITICLIMMVGLTSCAIINDFLYGEYPYTYSLKETDVEKAMSKAERTAMSMGFYVSRLDVKHGEMNAGRRLGGGSIEDTSLNFALGKSETGQLFFTLYVDTTAKEPEKIINEFVKEYGRYVKIIDPLKKGQKLKDE